MLKTSTELVRHALSGPTMGTRWSALFFTSAAFDVAPVQTALQEAVDRVDRQMSVWNPDSVLMTLNRAQTGISIEVPDELASVLSLALRIGRDAGGAFDIGLGDAVGAWGFGPQPADVDAIRRSMAAARHPAHEALDIDGNRVQKRQPITLDLNGIAKGYGVDVLAQTLNRFGIKSALVGIDGELRAQGLRPDGKAWTVAIEAPDRDRRAVHSVICLHDGAVATSGDYRHWVTVNGRHLSHTMDPRRGAPLRSSPASVTVLAPTGAEADAWATALMVLGAETGVALASRRGLSALFLLRDPDEGIKALGCGSLFEG